MPVWKHTKFVKWDCHAMFPAPVHDPSSLLSWLGREPLARRVPRLFLRSTTWFESLDDHPGNFGRLLLVSYLPIPWKTTSRCLWQPLATLVPKRIPLGRPTEFIRNYSHSYTGSMGNKMYLITIGYGGLWQTILMFRRRFSRSIVSSRDDTKLFHETGAVVETADLLVSHRSE